MLIEDRYSLPVYNKRPLVLVRGEGARVWDEQGRCYLDCVAGHGVASIGHANPQVAAAVARQAERLLSCPGGCYNDVRAQLLEVLASLVPIPRPRIFLCSSGAEAVEAALKLARLTTGRSEVVCASRGFHGRTLGALSATHNRQYRDGFAPLVPGFSHVRYGDAEALAAAVGSGVAAVLLEPVQGEGGVRIGSSEYLQATRALCDDTGTLLCIDEVQTGFCRTGRFFAIEHAGVQPDLLCLAKAMGGGFPIGAVVCCDTVQVGPGQHGSTFGGNPLACAAALAAIGFMREQRLDEQAAAKGQHLLAALRTLQSGHIREIRGLGLMVGIELREPVHPHLEALLEDGVLALAAGPTVLRLLPPLTIETSDLDTVVAAIARALQAT